MTGTQLSPDRLLAESEWLRRLASQLVADAHSAEDLAQETMLAALSRRGPSRSSLRAWLSAIARNLAAGASRANHRRHRREQAVASHVTEESAADMTERFLWHRRVCDVVMELDEGQRTVLLMRFWSDLPACEIALRLKLPVETVRTRIKRGLAKLRARLDSEHGGRAGWLVAVSALGHERAAIPVTLAGVLSMSTKTKSLLAVAALILTAWLGSLFHDGGWTEPGSDSADVVPEVVAFVDTAETTERRTELAPTDSLRDGASTPPDKAVSKGGVTIVGRLVDAETGIPIADAAILRLGWKDVDPQAEPLARSGTDGTFHIILPETELCSLLVLSRTHATRSVHPRNRAEQAPEYDFGDVKMAKGMLVKGIVLDRDRKPVADVALLRTVYPKGTGDNGNVLEASLEFGRSDMDGRFELEWRVAQDRIPNPWLVALSPAGIGWTELSLSNSSTELRDIEVVL